MITWANLRASAAPWVTLPALVYSGLYITANRISVPPACRVEAGEAVAQALPVMVGAAAAVAAWEAGRHRLLDAFPSTAARGALRRFVWAVTPVVVLQAVLLVASFLLAANTVGTLPSGAGGWLGVAHAVVLPLGWTAIGWRLGHVLPRSLAAPVAGIGGWMFLSFPQGMTNPWLRHLGGFIDGFSSPTDTRSPLAYLIPWAVLCGLVLALWLPALVRQRVAAISSVSLSRSPRSCSAGPQSRTGATSALRTPGSSLRCALARRPGCACRPSTPPTRTGYARTSRSR